jgi:hypothetical protein
VVRPAVTSGTCPHEMRRLRVRRKVLRMIEVPLHGLHRLAQERADATPELARSMRGAQGNEVGAMGELVAMRYLDNQNVLYLDEGKVSHDLLTGHGTMDVKTKERTVVPQPHYDCTVPDYVGDAQKPDWYLFVSLMSDGSAGCGRFKRGWVLGTIRREKFYEVAVEWVPGVKDVSNGWEATIRCWNVPVSALRAPKPLVP